MNSFLLLGMESKISMPIKARISQTEIEALKNKFFEFMSDQNDNSDDHINYDSEKNAECSSENEIKELEIGHNRYGEFCCSLCKIALHSNQIRAHLRWHEHVDGYACNLCRLIFAAKNVLDSHLNSDWHYNQTQKFFLQ